MADNPREEKKPELAHFHDCQGRSYTCDMGKPLGKGAQGMVLRVRDDVYSAIKIETLKKDKMHDAENIAAYADKIFSLRRLPVPLSSHISMPVAILNDAPGYVMRLLGDMRPIGDLLPQWETDILTCADEMPQWIMNTFEEEIARKHYQFYARSGGLRMRLCILLHLAGILGSLHGEGLLFGDLSPNNVLVGMDGEVWLIDVDNIHFDGWNHNKIWTQCYGAPEIARGEAPVSIAGDAYSFALLAFELLTMTHPFRDGAASEEDMDSEQNAVRGNLPWIYDSEDNSNSGGDPALDMLNLTPALFRLFRAMFEKGKLNKKERPQIWMFEAALENALDMCIRCPECGMSIVLSDQTGNECIYCDSRYPPILIGYAGNMAVFAHEAGNEPFSVPWRVFESEKKKDPALTLEWTGDKLSITSGAGLFYSIGEEPLMPCPRELTLDQNQIAKRLSFAPDADESRKVRFTWKEA